MIYLLVTFSDGNWFKTGFNGTFEQAEKYYLGQKFELDETKPMVECTRVEQIG